MFPAGLIVSIEQAPPVADELVAARVPHGLGGVERDRQQRLGPIQRLDLGLLI